MPKTFRQYAQTHPLHLVAMLLMVGLSAWMLLPALRIALMKWSSDPQYSHCYLVPLFSIYLLWSRRALLNAVPIGFYWSGTALIGLGLAVHLIGGFLIQDTLTVGSLILIVGGIFLQFGGWPALRWAWPAILFLIFMVPLPYFVETALGQPLRRVATLLSTWAIQTLGYPAVAEGNIIVLEHGRVAVIEACSGLSMLLTFTAMTTGFVLLFNRPLLDKIIILLSTPVIAVISNVVRITLNGVAVEEWGAKVAHDWFHDQAGWLMMPIAILLLGSELLFLRSLFFEAATSESAFSVIKPQADAPENKPTSTN